jgi:hypothetical protein
VVPHVQPMGLKESRLLMPALKKTLTLLGCLM